MSSLKEFASRMRKLSTEVDERKNKVVIYAAFLAVSDLIWVTPVDTSNALSNWQVGIGAPVSGDILPYVPGIGGSTRTESASEAMDTAEKALQAKKPGDKVFLSNLTPYIVKLDQGGSNQFAGGFVPRAVLIIRKAIEEYNRGIKWLSG